MSDVTKQVQIYFDPYDTDSVIAEDRPMLEEYYTYQRLLKEFTETPYTEDTSTKSK